MGGLPRARLAAAVDDMVQDSTPGQRAAFLPLFDRGTGLAALHHALASHQRGPEYERAIRARYPEDPGAAEKVTEAVGYAHDVEIPLAVAAPGHPVVVGIEDFVLHDELAFTP